MDKFFRLEENGTTVKREVIGGITTFLTMAYIIVVNPGILSDAGMPFGALVTATCLTAALATILMGLYANLPLALASGMGLNAYFAYSVCGVKGIDWRVALLAVFIEGIIFIILSVTKVREAVVNAIPKNLKIAVSAGIGLFIAFIGFVNAGLVENNDATLVSVGKFTSPTVLIALFGIIVIVLFEIKKVKGSILWGILASSVAAWIYAIVSPDAAAALNIFVPSKIFEFNNINEIFFAFDTSYLFDMSKLGTLLGVVVVFLFVDFFDTVGTLVGVASKADMIDKDGKVKNAGKALLVDAVGTTAGAMLGTSTVTTFVESSAGVAEGARTGLASVVTGILFILAMFFAPVFAAIPGCATAPALIVVGFFMMQNIGQIDFKDFTEGIPAFLTIALMPLTYSIGDGLTYGILSYGVINVLYNLLQRDPKKKKKVSWVIIVLTILFIFKLIFLH